MKKKYVVYTTVYNYCTLNVEARSAKEAIEIVKEMDYDEHHLKAFLSSVEIEVDDDPIPWDGNADDNICSIDEKGKINDLQRRILLNEKTLMNRDYDPINDDYGDSVIEDT